MPFGYFGGKKGLAAHYSPPAYPTIIEPFAGSAGYALYWATPAHRVILAEKDPAIVGLWRRLQAPDALLDIQRLVCPPVGERSTDLLLALTVGGSGGTYTAAIHERSFVVTPRMADAWPRQQCRLLAALPLVRSWTVVEGGYEDLDEILGEKLHGSWFIDPPYWVPPENARGTRGEGYRYGTAGLDFDHLAAWCRDRRGQVIVCEQQGADWLPFRPLRESRTIGGTDRVEVVWERTPGDAMPGHPRAKAAIAAARVRRAARIRMYGAD